MTEDTRFLVLYDIANARRLARAATIVLDYGIRLQKSVYEVRLSPQSLVTLQHRLSRVINTNEDGVKIIPLCASCRQRRRTLGAPLPSMPGDSPWLVV